MNFKPLILVAALGLTLNAHAVDVRFSDDITAVVDNDVTTQREVAQAVIVARSCLPKGSQISDDELCQQVLGQLVNQPLIIQAGKRKRTQASEAKIDAVLAQNPTQAKKANKVVRRQIADSTIVKKIHQQAIMQNSRVNDAEVDRFPVQARRQGTTLSAGEPLCQYKAQHILLKADSGNAVPAAESSIRKVYAQACSGTDSFALARQYSQDTSAGNDDDLGWFSDDQMVASLEDAMYKLKPGQVSPPVRIQFDWHIIRLNEVRDADTPEGRQRSAVRQYISNQKA